MNNRSYPILAILIAGCLCLSAPSPSFAKKRADKSTYGYTTMPYWSVGVHSQLLSRACQERKFGQKRQLRYIIAFVGKEGRAITGIATSTWNLYDPTGLSVPNQTYHFFNDGYSDCAVYVAKQPNK